MEINRNQYLLAGLVILLLGAQFRAVESFTLTPDCSQFVAKQLKKTGVAKARPAVAGPVGAVGGVGRAIQPPEWLGWALVSIGGVLILHSLAMRRPG